MLIQTDDGASCAPIHLLVITHSNYRQQNSRILFMLGWQRPQDIPNEMSQKCCLYTFDRLPLKSARFS
jgi:hypothetical protein